MRRRSKSRLLRAISLAAGLAAPITASWAVGVESCPTGGQAPAPGPGIAYVPGVDVNGRPVAPADLPGSATDAGNRIGLDGEVSVDIEIDIGQRLGIPAGGEANFEPTLRLGRVVVQPDGRVRLDDLGGVTPPPSAPAGLATAPATVCAPR